MTSQLKKIKKYILFVYLKCTMLLFSCQIKTFSIEILNQFNQSIFVLILLCSIYRFCRFLYILRKIFGIIAGIYNSICLCYR